MQLELLYNDATLAAITPNVQKTIAEIAQGKKPYCEKVLVKIMFKFSAMLSSAAHNSRSDYPLTIAPCPGLCDPASTVPSDTSESISRPRALRDQLEEDETSSFSQKLAEKLKKKKLKGR